MCARLTARARVRYNIVVNSDQSSHFIRCLISCLHYNIKPCWHDYLQHGSLPVHSVNVTALCPNRATKTVIGQPCNAVPAW